MPNYSEVGDKIASIKRKPETRLGGMVEPRKAGPANGVRSSPSGYFPCRRLGRLPLKTATHGR